MMKFDRERVRSVLLLLAMMIGTGIFLGTVTRHYAIQRWLVWRYATYWLLTIFWGVSCLSFGLFALQKLRLRPALDRGDDYVLAFPLGVFAFSLAIFLVGIVGLLGTAAFVLLPLAFLASGASELRAARDHLAAKTASFSRADLPFLLFGLAGITLLYAQIVAPNSFHYDARWYHLPIAEQYALQGAVRAFPEGWWCATYPHMASYIYTWPMMLPKSLLFDRLELCVHIQLFVFIATMASVPSLVRRLVPDTDGSRTWTALLLFPIIFLYDSNVSGAADHFAALFTIPLFLVTLEVWKSWDLRRCALFGTVVAAVMLTKYSAWIALPLPAGAFVGRGLWLAFRRGSDGATRRAVFKGFAIVVGLMILFTSTHFLANWIWYGDPMYPVLYKHLKVHPWNPDAVGSLNVHTSMLRKPEPGLEGVVNALRTSFTFSFIPNEFWVLHRDVPILGSLFTLLMFCLPFLRAGKRIWSLVLAVMMGLWAWYMLSHWDRYILMLLPWMAAVVAATTILIWRTGNRWARLGVSGMILLQIAWGADVPFFPTHNLINGSPYQLSLALASSGFQRTPDRLRVFGDYGALGEALPRDANVLVHDQPLHLGINARSVQDQWQGRISFAEWLTPARIQRELQALKITHLMWVTAYGTGWNCLAHDVAFWNFALNYTTDQAVFGSLSSAKMPSTPLPETFNDKVAVMACGRPYASGWYRLGQLRVSGMLTDPAPAPERPLGDIESVVSQAGFMVVEPACAPALPPSVAQLFHPPHARGGQQIYVRRVPR